MAARGFAVAGVALVCCYVGLVGWAGGHASYDLWVALVVLPLLLAVNLVAVVRVGRRDPDPRFARLLVLAFCAKMLATVARYLMAFVLYHGSADAAGYDGWGTRLAPAYRAGDLGVDVGRQLVGTGFLRMLTGLLYSVSGPSVYLAYAVFSMLGFWGLYALYRAVAVAVPEADTRRYACLVLLLPSMLFWPSGLGKEAWMTLALGLAAYGAARLLSGHRRWVLPLVAGMAAGAMVRPHIMAALAVAVAAGYLLGRNQHRATELTPLVRAAGVVVVLVGAWLVVVRAAGFLGVRQVTWSGVDAAVSGTAGRTSTGASAFAPAGVHSVADVPRAVLTVLFRPFLFEAHNPQMLLAAAEGTLLLVLTLAAFPRWRSLPARLRARPYLIACLVYAAIFVFAFSNFSNFGLLTRERVQVLPFLLVFLALPRPPRRAAPPAAEPPTRLTLPDRPRTRADRRPVR